jgi:hypothetical protein
MANIRTANKRHNRAIVLSHARNKAGVKPAAAAGKPTKAAR